MDKRAKETGSPPPTIGSAAANPQLVIGDATIHHGDALAVLMALPDQCVQTVVTSPPYWGLRDYGVEGQIGLEATPVEYVEKMVAVFREVRRVLRDDGTLWLNMGDAYDCGTSAGRRTSESAGKHGYWTNDAITHRADARLGAKQLMGMPWRIAFSLQADGWYLRSDVIWHKPNPMPESVTDRPTKSHEYLFLLAKSERYHYDHEAIKEPVLKTSVARCAQGFHGNDPVRDSHNNYGAGFQRGDGYELSSRNKRTVWTVPSAPFSGAHFATFPPKLIEPCILAGARMGDVVLDPFHGAGTTGMVALQHGRRYIGIEINADYIQMSVPRLEAAAQQMRIFA
jgi:DNA modification methylase